MIPCRNSLNSSRVNAFRFYLSGFRLFPSKNLFPLLILLPALTMLFLYISFLSDKGNRHLDFNEEEA